ncbi:hypothetical protein [Shouchella shacheensis]|nr:hypothetical protein [Shouchella shacheensis]
MKEKNKQKKRKRELLKDALRKQVGNWKKKRSVNPYPQTHKISA